MADTREQILSRLFAIYKQVAGEKNAFRNTLDVPEKHRPAIVLLDADESGDEEGEGRGRPASGPVLVLMTPETYILTGGTGEAAGTALNTQRIALIKAILTDQILLGLVKDGDIRYLGFATGLANGRSIEGEAGISFQFRYMIYPSKL